MTYNTFTSGSGIESSPMNNNFLAAAPIMEIYTGTDFNLTLTGTGEHEMTAIAAADLGAADYLVIKVTAFCECQNSNTDGAAVWLTYQTKETGSGYTDTMSEKLLLTNGGAGSSHGSQSISSTQTVEWTHTLTSGEKTNGVQVKIKSRASETGGANSQITNVQTILSTRA